MQEIESKRHRRPLSRLTSTPPAGLFLFSTAGGVDRLRASTAGGNGVRSVSVIVADAVAVVAVVIVAIVDLDFARPRPESHGLFRRGQVRLLGRNLKTR